MRAYVVSQTTVLSKGLVAVLALEELLARVCACVSLQITAISQGLVALCALEELLARVRACVSRQITALTRNRLRGYEPK